MYLWHFSAQKKPRMPSIIRGFFCQKLVNGMPTFNLSSEMLSLSARA